jgi:hypothetical protein
MIVIAGGDSFVWGSELSDSPHGGSNGYSRQSFTALLAKGHRYQCVAYPGLGNTSIAKRVRTACEKSKGVVIVSWSWPTRDDHLTSDREILQLQQYLEYHKFPYLFTCADNCVVTNHPKINWDRWFLFPVVPNSGWHTNEEPRGFYQWALENKYELALMDRHPLEQAHVDAANLMRGKFDELVKEYMEQDHVRDPIS